MEILVPPAAAAVKVLVGVVTLLVAEEMGPMVEAGKELVVAMMILMAMEAAMLVVVMTLLVEVMELVVVGMVAQWEVGLEGERGEGAVAMEAGCGGVMARGGERAEMGCPGKGKLGKAIGHRLQIGIGTKGHNLMILLLFLFLFLFFFLRCHLFFY